VSSGFLRDAEPAVGILPGSSLWRTTASVTHVRQLGAGRQLAATAAYGVNAGDEYVPGDVAHLVSHAGLLEGALTFSGRHAVAVRLELVGKAGHDLHAHEFATQVFPVGKIQVGYTLYEPRPRGRLQLGAGTSLSLAVLPPDLAPRYFGSIAPGFAAFIVLRPAGDHASAGR
jgi:hypothetical protein